MKDMLMKKVKTQFEKIEAKVQNGIELSEQDINETKSILDNVISMKKTAGLSNDEIAGIEKRYNELTNRVLNPEKKYSIKYIAKSFKTKVAAASLVGTMAVTAIACNIPKEEKAPVVEAEKNVVMTQTDIKVEPTTMDSEYKEIADSIVSFANDEIAKGMPEDMQITEENKASFAKSLTEYYLLNQMDELTDEEWANIFQNSSISSKDLMDAKYSWEWIDQQRVVVSNDYLDYSLLFDGKDAELLTGASEILTKVKSSDKTVKSEANKEFKQYVFDNLASDDSNILYSDRAMDTFRAVYFDAFDELTNHKVVDDELEHAINTTITCTIGESALDVEDKSIKGLQSEYQTYEMSKLDTRFQTGWNYVALNHDDINKYNDISYITDYVSENMDLTKQYVLPSYEETLANMFLTNTGATKHKNDSGISDGKGGHIAQDQINDISSKYGLDPNSPTFKEDFEKSVQAETQKIIDAENAKENERVNNNTNDFNSGYEDGINGRAKQSGKSEYYNNGYTMGSQDREAAMKAHPSNPTTTYEPVTNAPANETEVIVENNYTETITPENNVPTNNVPGTTFEGVDGTEVITEGETTTYDYIGAINDLKTLRDELYASIDNEYTSGRSI